MTLRLDAATPDFEQRFVELLSMKRESAPDVDATVRAIIEDVIARGDATRAQRAPHVVDRSRHRRVQLRIRAQRLDSFVALLRRWQPFKNLVSTKTLDEVWLRHIADSLQLAEIRPADFSDHIISFFNAARGIVRSDFFSDPFFLTVRFSLAQLRDQGRV